MAKLELNLRQKLNLTTQLITSIEIMQLNSVELHSFLEQESEDNVFIDYDSLFEDSSFREYIKKNTYNTHSPPSKDDDIPDIQDFTSFEPTLKDILLEQLGTSKLKDDDYLIGKLIVYNIDDDGYFKSDLSEISSIFKVSDDYVLSILRKIQEFEPIGIGARNLSECLLMQIDTSDIKLVNIIKFHLNDILKNNLDKIAISQKISIDELKNYISKIKSLNPKPASGYRTNNNDSIYIYPDIFVDINDGKLEVTVKESITNLRINDYYLNLMDTAIDDDVRAYLKKKLSKTIFLIESIEKRRKTIQKVANEIVNLQKDFFLNNAPLKPMSLKDIANLSDLSESTVSRITKNKYIQTKKGIYSLKYFFSSHINTLDDDISKDFVLNKINEIVSNENPKKPLSDQKITDILNAIGIDIKRRTVAKYRDELNIAVAKNRKNF